MLIGEVARRSGVSTRMLRHYDALGLVRPTGRTVGNYREYADEDIRRIFHVESLRTLGLSLRQIGRALADPGFAPADLVGELIRQSEERLAREHELLTRLRAVDASAPAGWPDVLRLIELLHGLHSPSAARRQQAVLAPPQDVPVPVQVLAGAVLAEADPNVAGALRWALARAGDDGVAGVVAGMSAGDADVRGRAVRALAEIPGAAATAAIGDALGDPDPAVRAQAALAAGRRGLPAAVPVLVAMVAEGRNDVEAGELLGTLAAGPDLGARIGTALRDARGPDPAVRIRLAQALAELPPPVARTGLAELAADDDPSVARVARALLAMLTARDQDQPGGGPY